MKLGEEGLLIHSSVTNKLKWINDKIDVINQSPKDVAGAGDSFLIVSSLSLAVKSNIWESAYLGMIASAIQVGTIGNIPIDKSKIIEILDLLN